VTPDATREIDPVEVMGPPARPGPVLTKVTVPTVVAVTVIFPVLPEMLMPDPAVRLRTPLFVIVTLPVALLTPIPIPAIILFTAPPPPPEELIVPEA
jgi:hypothetical protein